jgi:hypothetical protein
VGNMRMKIGGELKVDVFFFVKKKKKNHVQTSLCARNPSTGKFPPWDCSMSSHSPAWW